VNIFEVLDYFKTSVMGRSMERFCTSPPKGKIFPVEGRAPPS